MDAEFNPVIDSGKESPSVITSKNNRDLLGLSMEEEDVSLLRQPMRTALTGFLEAKKAYENGTDEVRRLLSHECSLIYECNVCRNMFRSLVNFITHKRIYCKMSFEGNNYRSYSDQNSSLIIQTAGQQSKPWLNKSRSTGSSPVPRKATARDLSKIIERLKRVDVSNDKISNKEMQTPKVQQINAVPCEIQTQQSQGENRDNISFYIQKKTTSSHSDAKEPVLQLESVPTSTQAVYQTLNPLHATDSIRTEVDEVHNLLISTQQNTMIGPDGKAISGNQKSILFSSDNLSCQTPTLTALLRETKTSLTSALSSEQLSQQISCELCQMQFQTEKTLNIHIQKKHTSSTYVFQCPTCSLTFLQPAAVIRHLANEHKKPLKRIRKMRDNILKKRIQMGDVQMKGPSRELKRLQMDSTKESTENAHGCQASSQNDNGGKPISKCSRCQGTFEKRAAFVMHLANCTAKSKLTTKDQDSSEKLIPTAAADVQTKIHVATTNEIQTKLQNQISTITKTSLVDNQNHAPHTKDINNLDQGHTDIQTSVMLMMNNTNQESELNIKNYNDFEYLTHNLSKVNIKQEPQEEEFNSTSTQATTGSDINEMFENLEKQTFGEGLQTVSLDLMVASEQQQQALEMEQKNLNTLTPPNEEEKENEEGEVPEEEKPPNISTKNKTENIFNVIKLEQNIGEAVEETQNAEQSLKPLNTAKSAEKKKPSKGLRTVPASKQLTCRCKICNKQFNALSNLRRHISMFHYRARRFGCNFCEYRAFRRYDIVNHLTFVHKMQGERESMAIEFVTMHEIPYSKDDVEHDIVVVQDIVVTQESVDNLKVQNKNLKTYENKAKRKHQCTEGEIDEKMVANDIKTTLPKVVRKRLRRSLNPQDDSGGRTGQRRPIRNRIKPVNNDFVYDLSALKEEAKDNMTRPSLKRRNTMGTDGIRKSSTSSSNTELTPPIKITPYRLRTEPLIPANRETVKGTAARTYRNAVHESLAAPSTLPEIPAERPQMRPRLTMALRNDSMTTPVIEATELEVARLESTFFDDSFLEKFAKKSNPSFKMKPLFSLQHSPLNSILQKFENNSIKTVNSTNNEEESSANSKLNENGVDSCSEENIRVSSTTTSSTYLPTFMGSLEEQQSTSTVPTTVELINHHTAAINSLSAVIMEQFETSPPNDKHIIRSSSPPSPPKKRITLMQRLAENRAKRRDTVIRSALEN